MLIKFCYQKLFDYCVETQIYKNQFNHNKNNYKNMTKTVIRTSMTQ